MEGSDTTITTTITSPSSSSSPPQSVVISPCAACKILRRRCVEKCVLAPYFPPNDPLKFTTAHRVFGASNIIKFLQSVVISPCAACKILRRRCVEKCVLAPYFPPNDPLKFTTAHRVFGASNIIKFLQELPEPQRADAVSSMVYEANARLRDPVYGCAGSICQLQKQVSELQEQLAKAQAEIFNMQCQHANLMALICMEMPPPHDQKSFDDFNSSPPHSYQSNTSFMEDNNLGLLWETLWT